MKKIFFYLFTIISITLIAQPTNYYDSCIGLSGDELRTELHNIIKDHQSFSYTTTKTILREADEDYNNPANILLVYTGNSIDKFDFASNFEPDFWNREHVWPKSHGDFDAGDPFEVPAYTDAHNLKPVDHSMNTLRGEKDFDNGGNVALNGNIETECYTTSSTFEPRDEVKGDIARMIFYMDLRYEGGAGEPNLVAVEGLTTYPNPQIGSLSTLLQWHEQDPPDAFEKRRNDVIYKWQGNRNPFIDYPQFVDYLFYENPQINPIDITNVTLNPGSVEGGQNFIISANVLSAINCPIQSVTLNYGNSWWETTSSINMTVNNNGEYECVVPGQPYNTMFCYSITAIICDEASQTFFGSEIIPPYPFEGIITPISEIQGGTEYSPYEGQSVNTTGIVTGAFANSFYLQDGSEPWSGIYIYSGSALPAIGDSVIESGEISEFCWDGSPCDCASCGGAGVTEFYQPDDIYIISNNNELPEPIVVTSGEALSEEYEGVLIKMNNVECVSEANGFGVWGVNDGSGICGIHNTPDGYEHDYQIGEIYNITGIVTSTFDEWKVDLRMPSDVESGPDTTPPYIVNHECYQVGGNYYIYIFFNEEINTDYVTEPNNFAVIGGDIQSINIDTFDPTKVIISLENVTSNSFIVNVFEMSDLIGNSAENIFYQLNCDFNLDIEEDNKDYKIFPNPNEGTFMIELYEQENQISIYNVQGKIILNTQLPAGLNKINLEKSGFYYIQINDNFNTLIIK